ncbi:MAG: 2,3-bisphosphoglycerate-independent phosphoglycerate mutase [Corallococcus sp.]|nr:2,3-bisphosphoglycerate-independent phosphoglycerate mutase [Corallococcus sp.]MCM1359762.1 2,3-bisphosphoglycerate-independent phosphoglycerate mutase [Corallococcus sp.]MCM1395712.1 2,3-bisphosphoglycerate-independent phosphoglycerate mutase [Corallococcus sp.]
MDKKITALIIMDGYGLSNEKKGNAVGVECSPFVRRLMQNYPTTTLKASGLAVGLPEGQMGNSEVGHLNMGAGRVIYQELTRITKSIEDGDFFENAAFIAACENAKKNNGKLHLMGLMSNGGVHSHISHVFALIKLAKDQGLDNVFVHCYMDGRDVSPKSGAGFVKELQKKMDELAFGKIATVCGRYYAMDRDNRWDRVEKAYNMLTLGVADNVSENAVEALEQSYADGITDEFVLPTVITENGKPVATIENGDSVIFFNFRPDRAREMTRAFTQSGFDGFDLKGKKRSVHWTCMTQYDEKFVGVDIAFRPETYENTLGEYLSKCGKTQLRIAETEKYAHVTFFFNGGVEAPNANESRVLVASPKVATYDLQPEMSAEEVCERAIVEIEKGKYDVMILNYANCDMVGHTGVISATEKAVAKVDDCVRRVVECILANGGRAFVTADHGNAEKMLAEDGTPFTAHTTNLVPFIIADEKLRGATLTEGALCDVAPTMLDIMGLEKPAEMTGRSLLKK